MKTDMQMKRKTVKKLKQSIKKIIGKRKLQADKKQLMKKERQKTFFNSQPSPTAPAPRGSATAAANKQDTTLVLFSIGNW